MPKVSEDTKVLLRSFIDSGQPLFTNYVYSLMSSILINTRDDKELTLITQLLQKMGVESKVLSKSEIEDIGLSIMMKEVDKTDLVNEEEINYKLRNS